MVCVCMVYVCAHRVWVCAWCIVYEGVYEGEKEGFGLGRGERYIDLSKCLTNHVQECFIPFNVAFPHILMTLEQVSIETQ